MNTTADITDKEYSARKKLENAAAVMLENRRVEHDVPKTPYMPTDDVVLVYRLPPPPKKVMTDGGLHIPETAQEDPDPKSKGILVQAGLGARDWLRTHGYFLGDIVFFGRFEGWEVEFAKDKKGTSKKMLLQLRHHGLLGSEDLDERLWGKKPSMYITWEQYPDGGMHVIKPIL